MALAHVPYSARQHRFEIWPLTDFLQMTIATVVILVVCILLLPLMLLDTTAQWLHEQRTARRVRQTVGLYLFWYGSQTLVDLVMLVFPVSRDPADERVVMNTLRSLEQRGLVAVDPPAMTDSRTARFGQYYSLTPAGFARLRAHALFIRRPA